jgi:hypothetical protein
VIRRDNRPSAVCRLGPVVPVCAFGREAKVRQGEHRGSSRRAWQLVFIETQTRPPCGGDAARGRGGLRSSAGQHLAVYGTAILCAQIRVRRLGDSSPCSRPELHLLFEILTALVVNVPRQENPTTGLSQRFYIFLCRRLFLSPSLVSLSRSSLSQSALGFSQLLYSS